MKILLVDDDEQVRQLVTTALTSQGYVVDVASNGLDGWNLASCSPYDLLLLDIMMPGLDGISFCRQLRAQKSQTLVILLTARDTTLDKMTGLDAGADDYLVKPIDLQELTARIRALLRRGSSEPSSILEWGDLRLNPTTLEVTFDGKALNLRRKEFAILELLMRNKQRVFSRSAILDQLWSVEDTPSEETVKAHIKAIRHQLRLVGAEELIETLYGQGYRLNPIYNTPLEKSAAQPAPASISQPSPTQIEQTRLAVSQIWQQTKHMSISRMEVLERALQALVQGTFTEELRLAAEQNAHKLHGSLGLFGYTEGSQIAKELETLFESIAVQNPGTQNSSRSFYDQQLIDALNHGLMRLSEVLELSDYLPATNSPIAPSEEPSTVDSLSSQLVDSDPLLLVVTDDLQWGSQLAQEAIDWNIRIETASDITHARQQVQELSPDVLMLTLSLQNGEAELDFLRELSSASVPVPVLVLTDRDRMIDRVAIARAGGQLVLPKSSSARNICEATWQIFQKQNQPIAKILVLDNDPQIELTLQELFQSEGFEMIAIEDPDIFGETLESFQPDVVLVDIELAEMNGVELCQAIRSDYRWNWIPIIILTADISHETKVRAYEVGVDDYICKPIASDELINRIRNRLERIRLLRSHA